MVSSWNGIVSENSSRQNVIISEATSGADLIVPRQGAGVGQSARECGNYLIILVCKDDDEEMLSCGAGKMY